MSDTISSIIKYGTFEFDFAALPLVSQLALAAKGTTHFLGNEQASKLVSWEKKLIEAGTTPEASDKEAKKLELMQAAFESLISGTVGVRSTQPGKPKASPLEVIMRRIAWAEVTAILLAQKLTPPKKAEDVVVFADGTELTKDALINRRLAKFDAKIRKEAEAEIKAREREAAKAAAAAEAAAAHAAKAAEDGANLVDALGL